MHLHGLCSFAKRTVHRAQPACARPGIFAELAVLTDLWSLAHMICRIVPLLLGVLLAVSARAAGCTCGASDGERGGCSFQRCFNASLCARNGGMKVFVYGEPGTVVGEKPGGRGHPESHFRVFQAIRQSKYAVASAERACLFVPNIDTHTEWFTEREKQLRSVTQGGRNPFWRDYPSNHLLIHFNDQASKALPPNRDHPHNAARMMLAQSSAGGRWYRPGFDVSIGLLPSADFESQLRTRQDVPSLAQLQGKDKQSPGAPRKLLLSWKGTKNTPWREHLGSTEARRAVAVLSKRVALWDRQGSLVGPGGGGDYFDLMLSSTFSLCPEGEGRTSYRVAESLRLGAVPVIIAGRGGDYELPFRDLVPGQWAVFFHSEWNKHKMIPPLSSVIRKLQHIEKNATLLADLRQRGRGVYKRFFSSVESLTLGVLDTMEHRVQAALRATTKHRDGVRNEDSEQGQGQGQPASFSFGRKEGLSIMLHDADAA